MKAFLSIKFWGDDRNREHVEVVIRAIEGAGFKVFCIRRNAEKWGEIRFTPEDLMKNTFDEIDNSQVLVADVTDWPIGVGVEAGYAFAKGIPVICICQEDKHIANTVAGFANSVIKYKDYDDLKSRLVLLYRKLK
jgi:2'-deoxynucleoside 5'-phosphate N-hydrolase